MLRSYKTVTIEYSMRFLPLNLNASEHVGLSISSQSLAGVVVDNRGQVIHQAVIKSPSPFIDHGQVAIPVLAQSLKELIATGQFNPNVVAVSIPEKFAFSRLHTFPSLTNAEVDEAVSWQIEKIFPYSQTDIYVDWRLIQKQKNQMTVVVTAVPRKIINGIKDSLHIAGLFPLSFEPSVTALARLVPKDLPGPVVMLELDELSSSATLIDAGVPQFTATSFFDPSAPNQPKAAIISRSVIDLSNHWLKEHQLTQALSLFVTGEGAAPELIEVLSSQLQTNCQVLPVNNLDLSLHAAYAVGLGAVLPPESERSINVLPQGLRSYYQAVSFHALILNVSRYLIGSAVISFLVTILSFVFIYLTGQAKITAVTSTYTQINAAVSVANLNTITQNALLYNRLFKKKITPENVLRTTFDVLPENVTLVNLTYDPVKKKLRLVGKAEDREAILEVHRLLADTDLFKSTDFPLSALSTSATGDFTFELEVKP